MMTKTTRRAILAGVAAAPIAGLPALALGTAPSESVRLLLDMERRYRDIFQQIEVAEKEAARCAEIAHGMFKPCPVPPDVYLLRESKYWPRAEYHYQRARVRYAARRARIDNETGYTAAQEALQDLMCERDRIRTVEVWEVKAVDIHGLKIKARMAALWGNMCASLTQDLLDLPV